MLLGLDLVCCFGFFLLHDNTCKDYFTKILIIINDFGSFTQFQRVSSAQFSERCTVFIKCCGWIRTKSHVKIKNRELCRRDFPKADLVHQHMNNLFCSLHITEGWAFPFLIHKAFLLKGNTFPTQMGTHCLLKVILRLLTKGGTFLPSKCTFSSIKLTSTSWLAFRGLLCLLCHCSFQTVKEGLCLRGALTDWRFLLSLRNVTFNFYTADREHFHIHSSLNMFAYWSTMNIH